MALFVAGIVMACAIALHNVPEGMTIGASFVASDNLLLGTGMIMAVLIGLHNIPEGMAVGVAVRYLFHFISGVAFFASYAPAGMSPAVYSLVANGTYLIPDLVICLVLYRLLPMERFRQMM